MQAPPGPTGPQLSPDGNYWWDGLRWVPMHPYEPQWQAPPAYQLPPPSPGLRPFLIVFLVLSDVLSGLLALAAVLGLLQTLGVLGPTELADPGVFVVFGFCFVLFGLLIASTIGVVRRSGIWARVITIVAGAALCLTCAGVVLGIPIIVAGARAPMTKPAPSGYA